MRLFIASFLCATVACGCAETHRSETPKVEQPVPATTGIEAPVSNSSAIGTAYPEKVDVERLLHQARELEGKGKFETALSVVNQALQSDANSPAATTMRSHLEEIIKRI